MNNEWNDDGFMIRLPTYNECFEQLVSYLGLDYDEGGTSAYKMNRIQDFYKLGNIYTNYYYPKILEIFDCKDENSKKYDFITSNLVLGALGSNPCTGSFLLFGQFNSLTD